MDIVILLLVGFTGIILGALINQLINQLADRGKAKSGSPDPEALLVLRREAASGQLLVTVDGDQAKSSKQLDNKRRAAARRLILELNDWLEPGSAAREEAAAASPGRESDEGQVETREGLARPSLNPVTVLVRALQADVKKSQLPAESIVSQINDILQEDLKNAPHIKDPVRLMEWPGTAMVVMVGLEKYGSVDEVPNADIRAAIQEAVKKWEQAGVQSKPGP
jgi:hypothetical protein